MAKGKRVITHINPDLDAVASAWLIKRFLPGWKKAKVEFVSSSRVTSKRDVRADIDPDVLWVDVGRGKLDHHQTGAYLSAARLCLAYIKKRRRGQLLKPLNEKALEALVEVVTQVDNAHDLYWQEAGENRYQFYPHVLIEGLRKLAASDQEVLNFGLKVLDIVLVNLKSKISAGEKLEKGVEFKTPWGKAIGVESGNRDVIWQGETRGYVLVLMKDPEKGGVRIYARPDSKVDLTETYYQVKKMDPDSDWFLHASKKLLLNQASVNPNMRPTKLDLGEIIQVLKKVPLP